MIEQYSYVLLRKCVQSSIKSIIDLTRFFPVEYNDVLYIFICHFHFQPFLEVRSRAKSVTAGPAHTALI